MYRNTVRVLVTDGRLLLFPAGAPAPEGAHVLPVHKLCFDAAERTQDGEAAQRLMRRGSSGGLDQNGGLE
jgi:hypothetical protein